MDRECAVPPDHPALPGHFPGNPIVPGVLLLEMIETTLRDAGLRVVGCPRAKFLAPVAAETPLSISVTVTADALAQFVIDAGSRRAVVGTMRCTSGSAEA